MVSGFGRARFRLFALGLIFAVVSGWQVQAETVPPCKTTAGEDGLLFEGTYALIFAPVAFDTVMTKGTEIGIAPEVRDGLGVLAYGKKASADSPVVEFIADGAVVHQCAVQVVEFDSAVHSPAQMQTGDCDLRVVAGRSQLMAGHGQVIEVLGAPEAKADGFSRSSFEASMGNPSVADLSTLSDRLLYLLGKEPGVTVLWWGVERPDNSVVINLCPLTVVSPDAVWGVDGPQDEELCSDVEGVPMRLSIGQTARMAVRDVIGKDRVIGEGSIANPRVAGFDFESRDSMAVTGFAPGSTSITLLSYPSSEGGVSVENYIDSINAAVKDVGAANCEVVVE